MDLSRFDTRQKAQEGVDVPLEIEGETIYGDDDQPIVFRTKGIADEDVHQCILRMTKAEARTPKEVVEADMKLARVAITGWSDNFTVEGEKIGYSKENVAKVLANPEVRRAVIGRIFENHRFMNGS